MTANEYAAKLRQYEQIPVGQKCDPWIAAHAARIADLLERQAAEIVAALREGERLRSELAHLDNVMSRRPALADCKTRVDKIEMAIRVAKRGEENGRDLERALRVATVQLAAAQERERELRDGLRSLAHEVDLHLRLGPYHICNGGEHDPKCPGCIQWRRDKNALEAIRTLLAAHDAGGEKQ